MLTRLVLVEDKFVISSCEMAFWDHELYLCPASHSVTKEKGSHVLRDLGGEKALHIDCELSRTSGKLC
jgi:hypothetical protein